MKDKYQPGTPCTVTRKGDLYLYADARPFIEARCFIVRRTRAGLIQVALEDHPRMVYSVPQRNVEIL